MGHHPTYLTLLALFTAVVVWIAMPAPTYAQMGNCPAGQLERAFPAPLGYTPGVIKVCESEQWLRWFRDVNNASLACGDGMYLNPPATLDSDLNRYPVSFVSPVAFSFPSNQARLQFYLTSKGGVAWLPWPHEIRFIMRSYAYDGSLLAENTISSNEGTRIDALNYIWYKFDNLLMPATQGGYFEFELIEPAYLFGYGRTWIANFVIQDSFAPIDLMCQVPDLLPPVATATPTPPPGQTPTPIESTPTPTHTPDGTNTPTPTPDGTNTPTPPPGTPTATPWPTSAGGTPQPLATATGYAGVIIAPPSTATVIPLPTFDGFSAPVILWPNIPPVTPRPSVTPWPAIAISLTNNVNESFYLTMTQRVEQVGDMWVEPMVTGEASIISGTGGIGGIMTVGVNTVEMVERSGEVFSFVKALRWYMPNLWPLVAAMLTVFGLIMTNRAVKLGIAIISTGVEVVRRIWDAIPFKFS